MDQAVENIVPEAAREGKIGGGYIILKRAGKKGHLRGAFMPWEHGDLDKTREEARRLADEHRGVEFVVFIADPMKFLVPTETESA